MAIERRQTHHDSAIYERLGPSEWCGVANNVTRSGSTETGSQLRLTALARVADVARWASKPPRALVATPRGPSSSRQID